MNVSAVSSTPAAPAVAVPAKAPAPVPPSAAAPADTVKFSPAAQTAHAASVDGDHDGDSR